MWRWFYLAAEVGVAVLYSLLLAVVVFYTLAFGVAYKLLGIYAVWIYILFIVLTIFAAMGMMYILICNHGKRAAVRLLAYYSTIVMMATTMVWVL
ncbi:MAG: hypothetical protein ACK4SY_07830 [Pyrobaculum sp.]